MKKLTTQLSNPQLFLEPDHLTKSDLIANADSEIITHQIHAGALPTIHQSSKLAELVNANTFTLQQVSL